VRSNRPDQDRRRAARIVDILVDQSLSAPIHRPSPAMNRALADVIRVTLLGQRLQQSESFRPIARVAIRVEMPLCSGFDEYATPRFSAATRIGCVAIGVVGAGYNDSRKQ